LTIAQTLKSQLRRLQDREEQTVTCAICSLPHARPRVLDCGHVYCESCLVEIYKAQRVKFRVCCPLCRRRISLLHTPPPCYPLRHQAEALAMENGISPPDAPAFVWPP
ncbi:hypothetical protein FB107DRAFT_168705, partial [Schizophyllum commune]